MGLRLRVSSTPAPLPLDTHATGVSSASPSARQSVAASITSALL